MILRIDILKDISNGMFCLDLKGKWLTLDQTLVPLVESKPKLVNVVVHAIETVEVPPKTIRLINVSIKGDKLIPLGTNQVFIKPHPKFAWRTALVMPTMVTTEVESKFSVPVVNPTNLPQKVYANSTVASIETVEGEIKPPEEGLTQETLPQAIQQYSICKKEMTENNWKNSYSGREISLPLQIPLWEEPTWSSM